MLISRITAETEGAGEGEGVGVEGGQVNLHEYQTASELFELMTKNRHFDDNDVDPLTTQDLVLLYKNIDIGTRLMNDATEVRRRKPNQHVETVVYNDEPESDSDISENFSNEDLQNVFKINQERLNLFDNGSFDNILCHKLGGIEIQASDLTTAYNRQFIFKDPYIKEHLKNLNVMSSCSEFESLFPASLLDYICCKRLEDNYNFYMDNIIKYVQHTIEQLKRISNGDYLTDRAKEKWEKVNKKDTQENNNTKVLATSTSIPLHVECKKKGNATWDDIVHSEMDVRSLSKILEKKIVVEIPKLICGSYRLFSKRLDDNLIISCKREKQENDGEDESRVDVVLKLQRSQTGQVISNISSIMILQKTPAVQDLRTPDILPLTYKNSNDDIQFDDFDSKKEKTDTYIECISDDSPKTVIDEKVIRDHGSLNYESNIETNDYPFSDTECFLPYDLTSNQYSSDSSIAVRDVLEDSPGIFQIRHEATFNLVSPDELRVTMHKLTMQSALPEENEDVPLNISSKKKSPLRAGIKSPLRARIKSPYENQSYIMEEKKRKRLLEIRDKRERKKMALGENAKVSKRKYGKGAATPQASSSVTKLSITNKSFYNSIYGQSAEDHSSKTKLRKGLNDNSLTIEVPIEQITEEYLETPNLTSEKISKKFVNTNYLDDMETEMMYMMKKAENTDVGDASSPSTSAVFNEFSANVTFLSQLIEPSDTDKKDETVEDKQHQKIEYNDVYNNSKDAGCSSDISPKEIKVSEKSSSATTRELDDCESKEHTIECRKSIDKLYSLMNKLGKVSTADLKTSTSKLNLRTVEKYDAATGDSTIQGSESGTSLKHHLTSPSASCFSFEKTTPENARPRATRKKAQTAVVVPKVIISSKLQGPKLETDRLKKDRKGFIINLPPKPVSENPLKAISQLLHEFDHVQKTRQKTNPDAKLHKKTDFVSSDGKTVLSRQHSFRRNSRLDQHLKENDLDKKITTNRDKRTRPLTPMELAKIPQQIASDDKHIDKVTKKKLVDILDEAKEARGEAVRGPSKFNSRLNSLAQPKRSYVQAHSEEYHNKYGKNLMADRLQRLATASPSSPVIEPIIRNVGSPNSKNRVRRELTSNVSVKQPPNSVQSIDKPRSKRLSPRSSPIRKPPVPTPLSHKHSVSDTPENVKKMMAMESYLMNHYERTPSPLQSSPLQSSLLLGGQKSRVPLLPGDIKLSSGISSPLSEKANELGKKLHYIIDNMAIMDACPLSSLPEDHESTPKISRKNSNELSVDYVLRDECTDSEYNIDILEDNNLKTAVECHDENKPEELDDILESPGALNHNLQQFNSNTELKKLENALYNQISGAFHKRLRNKNLTLTPKQSMKEVFLLQSGDEASVLVKSTVSNLKNSKCAKSLHDLKAVPVLSNSHLNWNFAQIPMQMSTVGYAFPLYQPDCRSKLELKTLHVSKTAIPENGFDTKACKSDKISHCFKVVHQDPKFEQAAQVEVEALSKVTSVCTEITAETSEKLLDVLNVEELPKVTDKSVNLAEEISPTIEKPETYENNDTKETGGSPISDNVDYTTSLDMLVGLLNEIQKITCQNPGKEPHCTELETFVSNSAVPKNGRPRDMASMTMMSHNKLRQLESHPSICSFYISSEGSSGCIIAKPKVIKPVFVDKEVNVNVSERGLVNTFTDVPSLLPITVTHSTNVTKSLIGVISEPSNQSMISFNDYNSLYSNTFFNSQSIKRIIELPQAESNVKLKDSKKTDLNVCCEIVSPTLVQIIQENKSIVANKKKKYTVRAMDFESAINIKRDILVTVYSILVLTVFAALSFPDMVLFES